MTDVMTKLNNPVSILELFKSGNRTEGINKFRMTLIEISQFIREQDDQINLMRQELALAYSEINELRAWQDAHRSEVESLNNGEN